MKEMTLRIRRIAAIAMAIAASLVSRGVRIESTAQARCRLGRRIEHRRRQSTVNGAGSTLAAPIYQQWASTL